MKKTDKDTKITGVRGRAKALVAATSVPVKDPVRAFRRDHFVDGKGAGAVGQKSTALPSALVVVSPHSCAQSNRDVARGYSYGTGGAVTWHKKSAAAVSERTITKLRALFCAPELKHRCLQSREEIFQDIIDLGGVVVGKENDQYAFKDNRSSILAVAHCDWVAHLKHRFGTLKFQDETRHYSGQLDDRQGVYTVLDLLPKMNINVDVLITDNEETGGTTAANFASTKQYKWIVEFDRMGDDVVTYRYKGAAWEKALESEFKIGNGSFSDICRLTQLGCSAVNVGIGYTRQHSDECHMILSEYLEQMARFRNFWREFHDIRFPYVVPEKKIVPTGAAVAKPSVLVTPTTAITKGITAAGTIKDEPEDAPEDYLEITPDSWETAGWAEEIAEPVYECSACFYLFTGGQAVHVDLTHTQCPECGEILLLLTPEDNMELQESRRDCDDFI